MAFNALPGGNGRRRFLGGLLGAGAAVGLGLPAPALAGGTIRVGMTPAFLNDQHALLAKWRTYMEEKLGTAVEFIRRDSYRETMDLLRLAKLDFAWICDYPYVYLKELVNLLVVPLNEGRPYYRSYLIVSANDQTRNNMMDLKGSVFAFADPYSNTGYLAPRYRIRELGAEPTNFFRKTFFTWSHRKVVEAVVGGYADAGAVDSFVWESLAKLRPELTGATRVIERSPEYGFPPFVAHRSVPPAEFSRMQKLLLNMSADPLGKSLLARLNLDGFVIGDRHMYDDVAKMMRAFGEQ
jgi:phosphonate transport system substrate-binding protein